MYYIFFTPFFYYNNLKISACIPLTKHLQGQGPRFSTPSALHQEAHDACLIANFEYTRKEDATKVDREKSARLRRLPIYTSHYTYNKYQSDQIHGFSLLLVNAKPPNLL